MAEVVRMPKLSDTMTEGVVAEWHKKVGDKVSTGDLLAEIETDKATMEFESFQEGVLLHIGVGKGKTAPVDSILAILGEKGEDIQPILDEEKKKAPAPSSSPEGGENGTPKENQKPEPAIVSQEETVSITKHETRNTKHETIATGKMKASPLARKLAKERNINLAFVSGTGDGGRVTKRDIETYSGGAAQQFVGVEKFTEIDVSQMRKAIARRLAESKFSAPHFYLTIEVNMGMAIDARKSINAVASTKISFNDLVIKAAASALRKHPKVNSSWMGDKIRYNEHIHIGVAVAVEEGLLVPVVKFADGKTLSQIDTEVKDFAVKARNKKLQPDEMQGNTFTVSNLGMFGIEEFTAIINPPDACILAVGGIKETPVVKDGQIVPGNVMKVTLSCDHRVVDGATGSAFLQTFKNLLENPVVLLGSQSI
ncbi:MAG: pyruvate dehydrogenase complex dihydrolipoamide acetyltransferase [Flavobacteriales bacterium]|nr:MAG: pyruvate dehydrogenase complex dihydrolipoamide acetyltransferase [Flavobacteriales bacterium]